MKNRKTIIYIVLTIILAIGLTRRETVKLYLISGRFAWENRDDITQLLKDYYTTGGQGYSQFNELQLTSDSYKRKPNKNDLHIPENEDQAFLDEVLKTIFPNGLDTLPPEDKCIEILRYVVTSLENKNNLGSATKIIKEGYAICGGMSQVFIMLCRKADIPTRNVNLYYVPWQGGHSSTEVFYDSKWHLFDSTFGIFFYSKEKYDKEGDVYSLHDFISSPFDCTPFKVADAIWVGKYDEKVRSFGVILLSEDDPLSKKHYTWIVDSGDSIAGLYRKMAVSSFPVAYGRDSITSFPVDADLSEKKNRWFGSANDKVISNEIRYYSSEHRFSGSARITSNLSYFPSFHTWTIKVPINAIVNIEYYSVKANLPQLKLVPLRAVQLIETKYDNKKVTFTMRVNDSEGIASIHCPDGSFSIDAMHIYRDK